MTDRSPLESLQTTPPRSGCLTALLGVMIAANAFVAVIYLGILVQGRTIGTAPRWALAVLLLFGLLNVASLIAVWRWRKWGFFAFLVSVAAVLFVNLYIGLPPVPAMVSLLAPLVLYALLRRVWGRLE